MGPWRRVLEAIVPLTVFAVLGGGLLALGLGYDWFWLVWVIGFPVVVPAVAIIMDALLGESEVSTSTDSEEALAALRERYARGDIDEAQFERRVERLLETETVADAAAWRERARSSPDSLGQSSERDAETEVGRG